MAVNKYWTYTVGAFWLCIVSYFKGQELVWSTFRKVAERHLESGSPPGGLEELHQGAELWAFNTDFSLEFPQPLMPYTVLVGGLLNKPAKPLEQVSSLLIHISKYISETQINSPSFPLFTFLTPTSLWTFTPPYTQPSLSHPALLNSLRITLCVFPLLPIPQPLLIPQDLELWISNFGEAGFIVMTLGSMVSSVSVEPLLTELVAGFSGIPQGVLWR